MKLIDLSVAIEDNLPVDPAPQIAHIEYIDHEAGVESMSDMNPELKYNAAKEDPYRLKKKSVRGGSWKDPESMILSAWRSYEFQNQPRSYVGFRCVRSMVTDNSKAAAKGATKQAKSSARKTKR